MGASFKACKGGVNVIGRGHLVQCLGHTFSSLWIGWGGVGWGGGEGGGGCVHVCACAYVSSHVSMRMSVYMCVLERGERGGDCVRACACPYVSSHI